MATWAEIAHDAADFAAKVRARFEAGTNKTMATLRADGSPRISATELDFPQPDAVVAADAAGQVTLGMMDGSVKLADARRDPRVAIHSPTIEPPKDDPSGWPGDAKLAGHFLEIAEPAGNTYAGAGFFAIDIREVVLTYVGEPADHLVIESWQSGVGYRRRTRK